MSDSSSNRPPAFLTDSSLYSALEAENFDKLKELQASNETRAQHKYFAGKIRELLRKKAENSQGEEQADELLAKCNESLKDLIVGVADFSMHDDIAWGGSSIVYTGIFKFLDVAIKKVSLNTMYNKQLVI